MESFSLWHWIVVLLVILLYGIPMARIIGRTGRSRWWVLAFLVPLVNIIALWVLAFIKWPALASGSAQNSN